MRSSFMNSTSIARASSSSPIDKQYLDRLDTRKNLVRSGCKLDGASVLAALWHRAVFAYSHGFGTPSPLQQTEISTPTFGPGRRRWASFTITPQHGDWVLLIRLTLEPMRVHVASLTYGFFSKVAQQQHICNIPIVVAARRASVRALV